MKLTLIKPNIGRMEPLPLGVLAGLTPPDIEVALYDDQMEPILYDEPTDLVAITVETFTARQQFPLWWKAPPQSPPLGGKQGCSPPGGGS